MSVLIACSMLKKELECLISQHSLQIRTVWMEKGLHEHPDKCRESLQAEIDRCEESETVLLAYGLCGNATLGLKGGTRTLVIPKFDDCIRMLLSPGKGREIRVNPRCLYFTEAWVDSDRYLFRDLDGYIEKYGSDKGRYIASRMIQGYDGLCMVDTGVFDRNETGSRLQKDADRWDLKYSERPGSTHILEKLLLGEWDEEFCQIQPERAVEYRDFEDRARCIE